MSNFRVGQKVVCIDNAGGAEFLTVGEEYVVSGVVECWPSVFLTGIKPPVCSVEGIWAWRFRPVIEDLTASLARTESDRLVEERPDHINEPQHA